MAQTISSTAVVAFLQPNPAAIATGAASKITSGASAGTRVRGAGPRGVPGGTAFDVAVTGTGVTLAGLGFCLSVTNLLDRGYVHPGIRDANGGDPGSFDEAGRYTGSKGYYNSLLPQAGRIVILCLLFRY